MSSSGSQDDQPIVEPLVPDKTSSLDQIPTSLLKEWSAELPSLLIKRSISLTTENSYCYHEIFSPFSHRIGTPPWTKENMSYSPWHKMSFWHGVAQLPTHQTQIQTFIWKAADMVAELPERESNGSYVVGPQPWSFLHQYLSASGVCYWATSFFCFNWRPSRWNARMNFSWMQITQLSMLICLHPRTATG